jgi:hypothetical protein
LGTLKCRCTITDKNINGNEKFSSSLTTQIEDELSKHSDQIMLIGVHLSDEDGNKHGLNAMRCMIETHLEGRQPIAVTHQADTPDQAFTGALDK